MASPDWFAATQTAVYKQLQRAGLVEHTQAQSYHSLLKYLESH